ncbi:MAG: ATP-dependent zinc metalloprotease FtsH [Actinomycetota bacterium]|nr:ATP-dependent zinc metalloprotease FtsH [Actinomycetota bacterium]
MGINEQQPVREPLWGAVTERWKALQTRPRLGRPRKPAVLPLTASLVALLALFGIALLFLRPQSPGRQIDLNRLMAAAQTHHIVTAKFLDEDARITGQLITTTGQRANYWVSYPRSDAATNALLQTLITGNAAVTVDSQSSKALVRFVAQFLLPLVIFANLFALVFLLVRPGGGGASEFLSFSGVGDRELADDDKKRANFSSVAGADEALVELAEVRDYLVDPDSFARMGALPPKGVLLSGPPGCGKTLLARAVAGEAKANFYSISGSNFVESLVGVGAARVRDLFVQARANTPAIIFIDELDAVGRQRGAGLGGGHDEREQTLNEMLVQMDGFSPTEGVAVLAASNRTDILDPALLRPGRFDRHITVERPDYEGRLAILRLHATGKRLAAPDTDIPVIARDTPGFTGADLANLLNEAALLARRERADAIYRPQLDEAVERVLAGPQRKGTLMGAEEKQRIAYHEAGHAVVAAALGKAAMLHKLSVVARGRGIGHLGMLSEDRNLMTTSDMEHQIAIAMAGLASEEMALGEPSTGSELDLERATTTARDMAGRYGMSPGMGRAQVLKRQGEVFLGRDYMAGQEISQPTLEVLDAEVRRILEEQEEVARAILTSNQHTLDDLVAALTSRETLQGDELQMALSGVLLHPDC